MRPIKFRGKCLDNGDNEYYSKGDWVYGYLIKWDGAFAIQSIETAECGGIGSGLVEVRTEIDSKTVGQFTGLHDKNGKEIYEGDKLRVEVPQYIHDYIEVEVEFDSGCFGIRVVGNPILNNAVGMFKAFNKNTKGLEIIGNIWENPTLLPQQEVSK